jgi:hypothetical protein
MQPAFQIRPPMQQKLGTSSEVLTQLFEADVNLAVWQRPLAPEAEQYAQQLVHQQVQLQQVVELDELQHWLLSKFADAPGKTAFVEDLVLVSQMLGCLLDCSAVGLRLKTLSQPMCPRFHTDHVAARLLVTYAGSGTEWLTAPPESDGQSRPQQLSIADVALLKGSAWTGNAHGAIWHRSPLSPQPRLLLTLDPVGE